MTQDSKDSKEVIRSNSATTERESRSIADSERVNEDLTLQQALANIRAEWNDDILPAVPNDSRFHYCWLSTNNQSDPIFRRLRVGYVLVSSTEMPNFGEQNRVKSGEYEGCIAINEMILAKIPLELYNEIMCIMHFDRPNEEEELLKANMVKKDEDSEGNRLGSVEGDGIQKLGAKRRRPSFINSSRG